MENDYWNVTSTDHLTIFAESQLQFYIEWHIQTDWRPRRNVRIKLVVNIIVNMRRFIYERFGAEKWNCWIGVGRVNSSIRHPDERTSQKTRDKLMGPSIIGAPELRY